MTEETSKNSEDLLIRDSKAQSPTSPLDHDKTQELSLQKSLQSTKESKTPVLDKLPSDKGQLQTPNDVKSDTKAGETSTNLRGSLPISSVSSEKKKLQDQENADDGAKMSKTDGKPSRNEDTNQFSKEYFFG